MQNKSISRETLWYRNAVFYGVIVKLFKDSNGDGFGDFKGLTEKLDYLKELGITCLWLLPIYPTAERDDGYDITDHYTIDPAYGNLSDFKKLVKEAKKRQIRIIIDLVLHHTSDKHPWFLKARKNHPKYKDYYVWTKKIPEGKQQKNAFPIIEPGRWKYDHEKKEYLYHCFYRFEPDLNIANPAVQKDILKLMNYWMGLGIDGFRMDAAYLMFEEKGVPGTDIADPVALMKQWNTLVKKHNPEGIILAEADTPLEEVEMFFGEGGRMDLMFNFLLNRYIFLSLATKNAAHMTEMLKKLPVPPVTTQWVNFLRNHDEVNLDQLTKENQEKVFKEFAPDPGMRIYDRGIRRRLAPMLDGDIRRLKMAYTLLFSLPGSIMILYGDEIGMGDKLELPERTSVRIPMQWDDKVNAGFSTVHTSALINEIIREGPFGYKKVHVAEQQKDIASLLNHIKNLIRIKKSLEALAEGNFSIVNTDRKSVFAIMYSLTEKRVLLLTNLSNKPCNVQIKHFANETYKELLNDGTYKEEEVKDIIALNGYGYRWFNITRTG